MSKQQGFKDKKKPAAKVAVQGKNGFYWMLAVCIILTFIAFVPVFKAGFVSWDDPDYASENQVIRSLGNFDAIVTTPVQGNIHPLTMLSLAINYAVSGKNAMSYHFVNLLLHLLNVILVFFFVLRLTGKKHWIAFITALLFGIHPLHVESVAWVAERKDVLYSFFFLCGLIWYLKYLENGKLVKLLPVLGFFVLSLLSKPAAVIFPLVLILIDYYYGRLKNLRFLYEKIPFFLLSLVLGILTVRAQTNTGAVADANQFPEHFRFFFGFYGLMMYIIKTVLPINLCSFYPFPAINRALPPEYYFSLLFGAGLIAALVFAFKRHKIIAFSILFYIVNLLLVLQFMPVGSAIIADRYAYMPLIGIFIIPGYFFQKWTDAHAGKPPLAGIIVLTLVSIAFTALCYKQATTWKDSASLWDKTLSVEPSSKAYTNRGLIYKLDGNMEKALEMYSKAISINAKETDALVNRGNIYFNSKKYEMAIDDYNKCLSIDSTVQLAIENRGAAYGVLGKFDLSLADMNRALILDPKSENGYANRASMLQFLNRHQEAIDDFYRHMKNTPDENGIVWNSISVSYQALNQYDKAIECLNKAITLNQNGAFFYNRAFSYLKIGNKKQALADAERAVQLGTKVDPQFLQQLR